MWQRAQSKTRRCEQWRVQLLARRIIFHSLYIHSQSQQREFILHSVFDRNPLKYSLIFLYYHIFRFYSHIHLFTFIASSIIILRIFRMLSDLSELFYIPSHTQQFVCYLFSTVISFIHFLILRFFHIIHSHALKFVCKFEEGHKIRDAALEITPFRSIFPTHNSRGPCEGEGREDGRESTETIYTSSRHFFFFFFRLHATTVSSWYTQGQYVSWTETNLLPPSPTSSYQLLNISFFLYSEVKE